MSRFKLFSRLYYFLLLILVIVAGGTIGFVLIEGWSIIDSFYMTVITVSTVGFGEVSQLTVYGKVFTAFLIITSFGSFAYAVTSITTYVVGGKYKKHLKEHKIMEQLQKLNNHVIICGFGRVGRQASQDLSSKGIEHMIIEINEDKPSLQDEDDNLFIFGDSTKDEVLIKAGIRSARAVITCLPKDADNLYVVLTARQLSESVTIVSRSSTPLAVSKLKLAGANNVIMPDAVGGSHMASLIANPDVMEFLDSIRLKGYMEANVETISYSELTEDLKGKTIGDLDSKEITGVTIIGYKLPAGEYIINPGSDVVVDEGSKLFVLGTTKQVKALVNHFKLNRE